MKRLLRAVCLALCWTLLMAGLPGRASAEETAPMVRVLLRRLQLTDRADLTLAGAYTVRVGGEDLMALPENAQVTVQIRSGALYLFYDGMSMRLGKSAEFRRNQSSSAMPGLRFEKNGNLYPGSLTLTVENGTLVPILTLSVEDYLLGVVPYEMSDSFPLEALKAQAVCARTYALSHLNASRAYDVVDTTNDQVFKGVDSSTKNAARAVQETTGIVGMYNGKLAECFYSASNGGQTELVENVWSGSGDYGYYAMVDDPYDLENPQSIVRTMKISKNGAVKESLRALIYEQMLPVLTREGYSTGQENFRIDEITAVTLASPAFAAPSRRMTELVVTLKWSGKKPFASILPEETAIPLPAGDATYDVAPAEGDEWELGEATATPSPVPTATATPVPTPSPTPDNRLTDFLSAGEATVTIALNRQNTAALSLDISGSEIFSVTEENGQFLLQSRRYGHGVGMSQRGAQWMAGHYSKKFDEILAFYYPGMVLMQGGTGAPALPTVPPELAATPAPPATPTPKPTLMPVTTNSLPEGAKVMYVNASSLNLRAEPSMVGELLMRLQANQRVIVLDTCDDPEWVHVKTDVVEGYCMVSYLAEEGVEPTPSPTAQ